jgi:hypothetical protein
MPTAIHDIFRFIKLYSPDGSTLEQTLEADAINDTLQMRRGDGVSWSVPTTSPGGTIAVTVGFHTGTGQATGAFYLDGTERNTITLVKGQTYIFDQSDASNAGYGGYNHPMTFSNTDDGAVSGAISGEEYATGVTYLIDDNPVSKTIYRQDFTTTTNRKIKIELNDSAPGTLYYCSHDNIDQGGQILTTAGNDLMMINVDYSLDVPPGTTNIELTDVNAATTHVELSSAGGIQLTRKNANEIEISSFAVAEIDTLHTVTTRNAITTNKLYMEDIEVGDVTSATQDGFVSPSSEFLGTGRVDDALRLAVDQREITTNTVTQTFTFNSQAAPGVLNYTIGYQLDSGTSATAVTASIQRYNTVTTIWETLDTVSGVGGVPYEVSNMYNEASASGGQYRVVYNISGNTGTITLELQAYYEILEITNNPVLRTESAVGTLRTRDLAPLGVNDIGRGSEPYDNVYANTFHGHLQGTFDGDLTGSLYSDDSTLLVDAINGIIYGTVDANIDRGTNAFTLDADNVIVTTPNDIVLKALGNGADVAQIYMTGGDSININSGTGNLNISSGSEVDIFGTTTINLTAPNGININNPVNTVIFGTAGFVGDLTGSVFGPDSTTIIDNNGTVTGEVNNAQVTTANLEAGNFTDTIGTITNGNITGFNNVSAVNFTGNYTGSFFDDGSTMLIDGMRGRIVGTIDADTSRVGTLTVASDTGIDVNGTGAITIDGSSIALNGGVGVDANGKLVNSANALQPFTIGSPVVVEKEFRGFPGAQEKQLYTNVTSATYVIDTSDTQNVYWNQPSGPCVANFTNLNTDTQRLRTCKIFINQGATAIVPTIEINGVAQSFVNIGPVAAQVNTVNIFEFFFYRTHTNLWEVYCRNLDANGYGLQEITDYGATTTNSITTAGLDAGSGTIETTGTMQGDLVPTAKFGYTSGGTATQSSTDKTGTVTINALTGTVTMDNSALAPGLGLQHSLSNSTISAGDMIICTPTSGGSRSAYNIVGFCSNGSANIEVRNVGTTTLSEAIKYQFIILKSPTT